MALLTHILHSNYIKTSIFVNITHRKYEHKTHYKLLLFIGDIVCFL